MGVESVKRKEQIETRCWLLLVMCGRVDEWLVPAIAEGYVHKFSQ